MMFEDWMTKMRATRKVPFGTAYELFAREAWNAAISEEREACAEIADEHDADYANPAGTIAMRIRERSNAGLGIGLTTGDNR